MSLQFKIKKETHVKLYEESLRTVPNIAMLKMYPAREGGYVAETNAQTEHPFQLYIYKNARYSS